MTTPKGNQAISTLKVGNHVQAYNPATKKVSTQTVQHVFINHDNDLIDVTLAVQNDRGATKHQKVAVENHGSHATPVATEVVHTTQKHPWLTTHGWMTAGKLQLGDKIQSLGGATTTVIALKIIPGVADMYDLSVSNIHTFAVGVGQWIVHNCGNKLNVGAGDNPLEGYRNVDINPGSEDVEAMDANNLEGIATGSQSEVVVQNPYGYDPLKTDIPRVLSPGVY